MQRWEILWPFHFNKAIFKIFFSSSNVYTLKFPADLTGANKEYRRSQILKVWALIPEKRSRSVMVKILLSIFPMRYY